jgi:hypothetical protein
MSFIFVFLRFEIAKSNSGQRTYKNHVKLLGTKSLWLKSQDVDIFIFQLKNLFNQIKQNALTRHFFKWRIEKKINSYPRMYTGKMKVGFSL